MTQALHTVFHVFNIELLNGIFWLSPNNPYNQTLDVLFVYS